MENQQQLFNEFKEYVQRLEPSIAELYSKFKGEKYNDAFKVVPYVIDGISWSINAITLLKEYIDYEININDLNGKLLELMDAFENKDNVLIGDIFEYEIYPIIQGWHKINYIEK